MNKNTVIYGVLLSLLYVSVLSINVSTLDSNCSPSESEGNKVTMCTATDISTEIEKSYLFDTIDLPVYRFGYNIEFLHYGVGAFSVLLILLGIFDHTKK